MRSRCRALNAVPGRSRPLFIQGNEGFSRSVTIYNVREDGVTINDSRVVIVGPFPPPVHGMAAVNAAVRERLHGAGVALRVIDLAAPSLDRSLVFRLHRLPRVLRGLARFTGMRGLRGRTLYMSVSGGLGQVYEMAFLTFARLRGMRIFLHHHSFAYLDAPSGIAQALVRVAGSSAVHVTQSPRMAERLQVVYKAVRVVPVSNAVFLLRREIPPAQSRQRLRTLGFISNISAEKGVFEFLDLMAAVDAENLPLKAKLAGPFHDSQNESAVRARLEQLENVEYVGPKYEAEKDAFFADIDALIFPTRYTNETEGMVNHEAMCHGVPVIAYGRGCIPEIIGADCGKVVDPAEPFVPVALTQIKAWLSDPAVFAAASRAAARRFSENYLRNEQRWRELLTGLLGGAGALPQAVVRPENLSS